MTDEEKQAHKEDLVEELKTHDPIVIATAIKIGEKFSFEKTLGG